MTRWCSRNWLTHCQRWVASAAGRTAGPRSCMQTRAMTTLGAVPTSNAEASRIASPARASSAMTGSGATAGSSSAPMPGWRPLASCAPASSAASTFIWHCFAWHAASSAFAICLCFVSSSKPVNSRCNTVGPVGLLQMRIGLHNGAEPQGRSQCSVNIVEAIRSCT